jgi:hypothetical protein
MFFGVIFCLPGSGSGFRVWTIDPLEDGSNSDADAQQ